MVEFNTLADRNLVKKAAESLKGHPESKKYFVKADITKNEREELTRLFKMKEEIMIDNPGSFVEIKYGKLLVNSVQIDQVKQAHQDF